MRMSTRGLLMKIFMSNTENKIDSKARVSIPSQFRSVLDFQAFETKTLCLSCTGLER